MKYLPVAIAILLMFSCSNENNENSYLDSAVDSMLYFGQTTPSKEPVLFAPGIISKPDRHEFGCTMSEDGKEFYFGVDNDGQMEIYKTTLQNGTWSPQENFFPGDSSSNNDPMFSPDENRLYFISNRPLNSAGNLKDIDIWYVEREGKNWSSPINAGAPINNHLDQYYISFNQNGDMYFASKDTSEDAPRYAFDIYKSEFQNDRFLTPEKLPGTINTDRYEADVFIAPDESFMIFCAIRRNGLGRGDLYISFKDEDGNWLEAKNMGSPINTENHELCPFVTKDGKYFFYTSNQDIYWLSTDIFNDYRSRKDE